MAWQLTCTHTLANLYMCVCKNPPTNNNKCESAIPKNPLRQMNEERYMDLQSLFLSQTYSQAPVWVLQISVHGMQPAIHRTFPSKEKFGSFRGILIWKFSVTLHRSFCRSSGRFLESLKSNSFRISRLSSFRYINH